MEEIVALLECVEEVLIAVDGNPRNVAELLDVFLVLLRLLDHHSLVRSPCRKHLDSERIVVDLLVIFKSVSRVIGSTYNLDIESLHEGLSSVLFSLEFCCTLVVDCASCLRAQKIMDAENSCELEVRPVIQWISHCIRHCLSPFLEFFVAVAASCDEFLRNAVTSHCSPLVVVASKPHFSQVSELIVVRNHLRNQVTVVVDDRHLFCALMVEFAGEIICEHEIVIDERLAACQAFKI